MAPALRTGEGVAGRERSARTPPGVGVAGAPPEDCSAAGVEVAGAGSAALRSASAALV
jgi:hypothetical protein